MTFSSSTIDRVRAFALSGGVGADGKSVVEPLSALVRWRSEHNNKLHQVYVNGQFAGVTNNCSQRSIVISIPTRSENSLHIAVYSVDPAEQYVDFSDELESLGLAGQVRLSFVRRMSLPFEGSADIYSGSGSGQINYDEPASNHPVIIWPGWQDKCGFGLSKFGISDFGYDGSAAVGFCRGIFGLGEFGFDTDMINWVSGELSAGEYKFAVKVTDVFGDSDIEPQESEDIVIIPPADGADGLEIDSYDIDVNELILKVN